MKVRLLIWGCLVPLLLFGCASWGFDSPSMASEKDRIVSQVTALSLAVGVHQAALPVLVDTIKKTRHNLPLVERCATLVFTVGTETGSLTKIAQLASTGDREEPVLETAVDVVLVSGGNGELLEAVAGFVAHRISRQEFLDLCDSHLARARYRSVDEAIEAQRLRARQSLGSTKTVSQGDQDSHRNPGNSQWG